MINVGSAVGYLLLDTSRWTGGLRSARSALEAFRDEAATTADRVTAMGQGLGSIGKALTVGVTAPLVGLGAAAVKTSMQFDTAMSKVSSVSGATGEDLERLRNFAKEMGATTAFSASEAAEAMNYMAMAGWKTEQMIAGLPGILDLAAASGTDLATTSDIVTDALTAFGLTAEDTAMFVDVIAAASANANTNVVMLGESFKYVAPVAGALGYSVKDTAFALGLMANAGIKSSQAGTSLRTILTNMVNPTDKMQVAMDRLGITLEDENGNMRSLYDILIMLRKGFNDSGIDAKAYQKRMQELNQDLADGKITMEEYDKAVEWLAQNMLELTDAEVAQYAAMLAGKEGMSGLLALVTASDEDFESLYNSINDSSGAAKNMADVLLDNLGGQITILKSGIEGLAISIGEALTPKFSTVLEIVQNVVNWLNSLNETQLSIVVTIGMIAAALGPVLVIVGKVLTTVGMLMPLISGAGGIGAAIAALVNPITLVIAAIGLLVTAWVTDFGGIREATEEIFAALQVIFTKALEAIKYIWDNDIGNIRTVAIDAFNMIRVYVHDVLTVLVDIVQLFAAAFSGDWEEVWRLAQKLLEDALRALQRLFHNGLNLLLDILTGMNELFQEAARALINLVWEAIKIQWGRFMDWFNSVKEDPVGAITSIGEKMYAAGAEIFTQLWNGLQSVWESIASWVEEKVDWLMSKLSIFGDVGGSIGSSSVSNGSNGKTSKGLSYTVGATNSIAGAQNTNNALSNLGSTSSGDTIIINSPTELSPTKTARAYTQAKKQLALGSR